MMPPPGLEIYLRPGVTSGIVRQWAFTVMPGLFRIRRIVVEISRRKRFLCDLLRPSVTLLFDYIFSSPKFLVSCACHVDHLCQLIYFQNIAFRSSV